MLEYLRIQNLALIEDMALEFSSGINVLTGETGAGKSFILKALNFLTGERLGSDLVRPGKEKAVVEALFSMPDGDLALRREFLAENSRSRLFINDRLSSQEAVRDLRPALILHTSQHGQQKLLQSSFQAQILDDFMDQPELLRERDEILKKLAALNAQSAALQEKSRELSEKRDLLEFQRHEIDQVKPEEGEEEELEAKRAELRGRESRQKLVEDALTILHGETSQGLIDAAAALERQIRQLAGLDESFAEDAAWLEEAYPTLRDLASRLRKGVSRSRDEYGLNDIEKRLFTLAQLKRKLHRTLPQIMSLKEEIDENLSFLDSCKLDLIHLARQEADLMAELAALLDKLNPARRSAAKQLSAQLENELKELGFSEHVSVEFAFSPKAVHQSALNPDLSPCLEDKPALYWKPNPGQNAQPLERIASGGELSRFLLAVISLMTSRLDYSPVLIFDEVDAGVGGLTLNKVAEKLGRLGQNRQMLLITHWPKLASTATRHFFVQKEVAGGETFTTCQRLDEQGISAELMRMAGENPA